MSTTPPFPCSIVGILTPLVGFLLHLRSAEASWRSWVGFKIFLRSFYPEYGARVCPLLAGRCCQVTSLSIMLKSNALRSIFRMESEAKMKENVVKPGCWAGAVQELMHCGSGPCFCGTWIKFPWAVPVSGCLELQPGAPLSVQVPPRGGNGAGERRGLCRVLAPLPWEQASFEQRTRR